MASILSYGSEIEYSTGTVNCVAANVYPDLAVAAGGAGALNLMDQSVLTPEIVSGGVFNTDTWVAPQLPSGLVSQAAFEDMNPEWEGWGAPLSVMRVKDPLLLAELIGHTVPSRMERLVKKLTMTGWKITETWDGSYTYAYDAYVLPSVEDAHLLSDPITSWKDMPDWTPTTANISNASSATFESTTGGQIVIFGPSL